MSRFAPTAWTRFIRLVIDVAAFIFWHFTFAIHSVESALVTWYWNKRIVPPSKRRTK